MQQALAELTAAARTFARARLGGGSAGASLEPEVRTASAMAEAEVLGIVPRARGGGVQVGLWAEAQDENPAVAALTTIAMLEELAAVDAGFATAAHAASLGAWAATDSGERIAVALFEGSPVRFGAEALPQIDSAWRRDGGAARLWASKRFVVAAPGTEGYVVFALDRGAWTGCVLHAGQDGVSVTDAGYRESLRGCVWLDLKLDGVRLEPDAELSVGTARGWLARYWLGQSAIALGNARGAWSEAAAYATERFQGGSRIAEHPAIRLLLGRAEANVSRGRMAVERVAESASFSERRDVRRAAACRVGVVDDCARAVTDCLQVLGGYGYMDDYGLARRLRDGEALRGMGGRPDDILQMLAWSAGEGP